MQLVHKQQLAHGTHIKKVLIDPRLRRRIPTGIEFIDKAVGYGGFVPSSVMMLTGDAGCGKTTLALQLANSLTQRGSIVLFNTSEQAAAMVAITAERLGLDHGFYIGTDNRVDKLLAHADKLKASHPATSDIFVIQDSLPALLDPRSTDTNQWMNGKSAQHNAECLVDWAQAKFGVVIFINHVTKGGEFAGKNTILHTVDSHARLFFDKQKTSDTFGERMFSIGKNRWGVSGVTSLVGMSEKGLTFKGALSDHSPDDEV
jgi:DNA repair protein RadA/Sms